jgi:hypothetical protein
LKRNFVSLQQLQILVFLCLNLNYKKFYYEENEFFFYIECSDEYQPLNLNFLWCRGTFGL